MRCTSLPTAAGPDSIAEAFRRRITVLELQQIIGRGRGLWRTADNPLHVLVLTDVPLDMPVEELTTDAAERPSFEDRQIAVGALAFECAAHAAKAFPEMWKDADRAQDARRQHGRGQPAGTIAWQYRIAGQGERSWRVYAPPHSHAAWQRRVKKCRCRGATGCNRKMGKKTELSAVRRASTLLPTIRSASHRSIAACVQSVPYRPIPPVQWGWRSSITALPKQSFGPPGINSQE